MADKPTITEAELNELVNKGAKITREAQPMVIARFDELLSKLDAMLQANVERVQADIARNQTNLEILATLQALIRNQVSSGKPHKAEIDQIKTVLAEITEQRAMPKPAYEFTIDRDNRGFMSKIVATPQGHTTH